MLKRHRIPSTEGPRWADMAAGSRRAVRRSMSQLWLAALVVQHLVARTSPMSSTPNMQLPSQQRRGGLRGCSDLQARARQAALCRYGHLQMQGVQRLRGGSDTEDRSPRVAEDAETGMRIFCGTWNVNGKPPLVPIEDWLLAHSERDEVDIYVIGLQEVQSLSGTAALLTDEEKGRPWSAILQQTVGAPSHFRCIAVRQMVGCYITVLVRTSLCSDISDVKVGELGTGFLNSGGNKGGVAVRFKFRGVSVCAISSHLAAQVSEVKRRNQDISELISRLHFVENSILAPIKAEDVYDDGALEEDPDEGTDVEFAPDVYDSPMKTPGRSRQRLSSPRAAANERQISPCVLDSAESEHDAADSPDEAPAYGDVQVVRLAEDECKGEGNEKDEADGPPTYDEAFASRDAEEEGVRVQQSPLLRASEQGRKTSPAAAASSVGARGSPKFVRTSSCPDLSPKPSGRAASSKTGSPSDAGKATEQAHNERFLRSIPPAPIPSAPGTPAPKAPLVSPSMIQRSSSQIFGQLSSAIFGHSLPSNIQNLGTKLAPGPRLLDHDVIIWLGDLNYRLNLPEDAILALMRHSRLDMLKEFDQLTICKKTGEIFEGFHEPPLDFVPTYKYEAWSTEYARKDSSDHAGSGGTAAGGAMGAEADGEVQAMPADEGPTMPDGDTKLPPDTGKTLKRPPAWCDRVLFRDNVPHVKVEALAYNRHEVLGSDHRPVSALLHVALDHAGTVSTAAAHAAAGNTGADATGSAGAGKACTEGAQGWEGVAGATATGGVLHEEAATAAAPCLPTAVLFDLSDELVVADKEALLAGGICPSVWGGRRRASGAGKEAEGRHGLVLRVCKRSKVARWGPIDAALRSGMVAASTIAGGGGGRTEMGGGGATEVYGVIGMAGMSFVPYLIVATNVSLVAKLPQGCVMRITETQVLAVTDAPLPESMEDERAIDDKEFGHLKEISGGWGLFYSPDFDVTQTQQRLAGIAAAAHPGADGDLTKPGRCSSMHWWQEAAGTPNYDASGEAESGLGMHSLPHKSAKPAGSGAQGLDADGARREARDMFVWNTHLLEHLRPSSPAAPETTGATYAAGSGGIARQWSGGDVLADTTKQREAELPGRGGVEDWDHEDVDGKEEHEDVDGKEVETEPLAEGMVQHGFLLAVVCGYAQTVKVKVKTNTVDLTLVSRRSRFRSGVRFYSRGVNDDGHVSNFVETEQIVTSPTGITSFVTVRGSIPLYWQEGEALVTLKPKPHVLPGRPHLQAMETHFASLAALYGPVLMLSLIDSVGNEANIQRILTGLACRMLRARSHSNLGAFEPFDFHAECGKSASSGAAKRIAQMINDQGSWLDPTNLFVSLDADAQQQQQQQQQHPGAALAHSGPASPHSMQGSKVAEDRSGNGEEHDLQSESEGGRGRAAERASGVREVDEGVSANEEEGDGVPPKLSRSLSPCSRLLKTTQTFCAAAIRKIRRDKCKQFGDGDGGKSAGAGGIGISRHQHGVSRVNCIDCLDRTNVVQSAICMRVFVEQLRCLKELDEAEHEACRYATRNGHSIPLPAAESSFKNLWSDNGDALSLQYAGTGALKGDFTRKGKRTMGGILADLSSNVKRAMQNNFADVYRQRVIDLMHGQDTSGAKAQGPAQEAFASSELAGYGDREYLGESQANELDDLVSDEAELLPEEVMFNLHCPARQGPVPAMPSPRQDHKAQVETLRGEGGPRRQGSAVWAFSEVDGEALVEEVAWTGQESGEAGEAQESGGDVGESGGTEMEEEGEGEGRDAMDYFQDEGNQEWG